MLPEDLDGSGVSIAIAVAPGFSLALSCRGSGGAAHARGARGVSPQFFSSLGVGAEQRESDAPQTWQSFVAWWSK
jgi:hypothetical protein